MFKIDTENNNSRVTFVASVRTGYDWQVVERSNRRAACVAKLSAMGYTVDAPQLVQASRPAFGRKVSA
jgi:hypothetical protein